MPPESSRAAGQRRHLGLRHLVEAQHGVGEHLAQPGLQRALARARQGREVDLQRVGQLDEEGGRDGALVVLDQVQVAGGDAEPGGERLLRQPLLQADPADRPAQQRAGHRFSSFTLPPVKA
jgi:hypothetical protein